MWALGNEMEGYEKGDKRRDLVGDSGHRGVVA
jgi:hypothetical protein